MATILDLFQAVKTAWTAEALTNATLAAINGPYDEKPVGIDFPYAIFFALPATRTGRTSHSEQWEYTFRLIIRHTLPSTLETYIEAVGNYFDPLQLNFGPFPGAILRLDRVGEDMHKEDKSIWVGYLQYETTRNKPRLDV